MLPTLQITAFESAIVCYWCFDLLLVLIMSLILAGDVPADAGTNTAADVVTYAATPAS